MTNNHFNLKKPFKLLVLIMIILLLAILIWDLVWINKTKLLGQEIIYQTVGLKKSVINKKWNDFEKGILIINQEVDQILALEKKLVLLRYLTPVKNQFNRVDLINNILDETSVSSYQLINSFTDGRQYAEWDEQKRINYWNNIADFAKTVDRYSLDLAKSGLIDYDIKPTLQLIAELPKIIGAKNEVEILVLFQNETEMRPTGGFWGTIGEIEFKNGLASTSSSYSISDINQDLTSNDFVPEDIKNILVNSPDKKVGIQFINSISEFDKVMKVFQPIVEQHTGKKYAMSLGVNIQTLSEILAVIGDIDVNGIGIINPKNIFDKVVYEPYQKNVSSQSRADRKKFIGSVGTSLINKLLSEDPIKITEIISKALSNRGLLLTSSDPILSEAFSSSNIDNTFRSDSPNFILYEEINFGGKQSLMLERYYHIENIGNNIFRTVFDYHYIDSEIARGLELMENKTLVRIRLPKGSKLIKSTGYQNNGNELDINDTRAFSNILLINPGEQKQITFEYELSENVNNLLNDFPIPKLYPQPGIKFNQ